MKVIREVSGTSWCGQFWKKSEAFAPLRDVAAPFSDRDQWPNPEELVSPGESLLSGCGIPLRCVLQAGRRARPPPGLRSIDDLYQLRIFLKGELPTRSRNWHDYFNFLVWKAFPRSKAVLNSRFFECFDANAEFPWSQAPKRRSATEDTLTLFDEGGLLVVYEQPEIWDALKERRWHDAFWHLRPGWGRHTACVVFGHALYEGLLLHEHAFHGSALGILVPPGTVAQMQKGWWTPSLWLSEIDHYLEKVLLQRESYTATDSLTPFPVRGVPGWDAQNALFSYYEDETHFRKERFTRDMAGAELNAHGPPETACF